MQTVVTVEEGAPNRIVLVRLTEEKEPANLNQLVEQFSREMFDAMPLILERIKQENARLDAL